MSKPADLVQGTLDLLLLKIVAIEEWQELYRSLFQHYVR